MHDKNKGHEEKTPAMNRLESVGGGGWGRRRDTVLGVVKVPIEV